MSHFKQYTGKRLFFDGDSLFNRANGNIGNAYAAPIDCYNALTGIRPPMFNFAIGGRRVDQLTSEFPTKIGPSVRTGDIVIMNELTNSLFQIQNPTTVYNDLLAYATLVKSYGCKVVVYTLTARGDSTAVSQGFEAQRLTLNSLIMANNTDFDGIANAGALSEFGSYAATANTTYYDADLCHFATAGYTLFGQTATPIIQSLL